MAEKAPNKGWRCTLGNCGGYYQTSQFALKKSFPCDTVTKHCLCRQHKGVRV